MLHKWVSWYEIVLKFWWDSFGMTAKCNEIHLPPLIFRYSKPITYYHVIVKSLTQTFTFIHKSNLLLFDRGLLLFLDSFKHTIRFLIMTWSIFYFTRNFNTLSLIAGYFVDGFCASPFIADFLVGSFRMLIFIILSN